MEMHKAISNWGNIKNKQSNKTGFSKQTIMRYGLSDSCKLRVIMALVTCFYGSSLSGVDNLCGTLRNQ